MQRNWDLIREILIATEELPDTTSRLNATAINGYDQETVSYHLSLLNEAGLIIAQCSKSKPVHCFGVSLTWQGHELLDKIKQQGAWNKTKNLIKEKGLTLSYDALKVALTTSIKELF